MGNRGNQDYYKIAGTRTEDRDLTRRAHEHLAKERAVERHQPHEPTGPRSVPLHLHAPPKFAPAAPTPAETRPRSLERVQPPLEPGPGLPTTRMQLVAEAARFAVGTARSAVRFVAGTMWRSGRKAIERRVDAITARVRAIPRRVLSRFGPEA